MCPDEGHVCAAGDFPWAAYNNLRAPILCLDQHTDTRSWKTHAAAALAPASSTPRATAGAASAGTVSACASLNRLNASLVRSHRTTSLSPPRLTCPRGEESFLSVSPSTDAAHDPHPWALDLDTLHDQAWQRLIRGVRDRHAPARHPSLATVSPDGFPQVRTVVLRAADRSHQRLEIHTNLFSAKVEDLRHTPHASRRATRLGQWFESADSPAGRCDDHLRRRCRRCVVCRARPVATGLQQQPPTGQAHCLSTGLQANARSTGIRGPATGASTDGAAAPRYPASPASAVQPG